MEILKSINGFMLVKDKDFYCLMDSTGNTMVNTSGTREKLLAELNRFKNEIDYNNTFMLEVENEFIKILIEQSNKDIKIGDIVKRRTPGGVLCLDNKRTVCGLTEKSINFDCCTTSWISRNDIDWSKYIIVPTEPTQKIIDYQKVFHKVWEQNNNMRENLTKEWGCNKRPVSKEVV